MQKIFSALAIFILGLGLGASISLVGAAENTTKPAYMIVSSERDPSADYSPYSSAAGPLAREAGMRYLAPAQEPVLLEGEWPFKNITLEIYPSMKTLTDFWFSDGYQEAKKLREGLGTINFIVAVEGN